MALESFDTLNVEYIYMIILEYVSFIISYYKSHYNVTYSTEEKHKIDEWWVEWVQVLMS